MTTDLEAFTAAYMAACEDRPADWNEIGYWYARNLWEAAIKYEREACAETVTAERVEAEETQSDGDKAYNLALVHAAAAIRNRKETT